MFILLLCFATTSSALLPSAPLFLSTEWIYTPIHVNVQFIKCPPCSTYKFKIMSSMAYYLRAGLMAQDCLGRANVLKHQSHKSSGRGHMANGLERKKYFHIVNTYLIASAEPNEFILQ